MANKGKMRKWRWRLCEQVSKVKSKVIKVCSARCRWHIE